MMHCIFLFQSYAGKYVPALAYYILNQKEKLITNLKGIAVGDGFSDPPTVSSTLALSFYNRCTYDT